MSSAYVVSDAPVGGCGRSEVYRLKRTGDSTPPWGTPVLNCCCLDLKFWYRVKPLRPLM